MNEREAGEMAANVKNLCAAVERLENKLDDRLDKVEEKEEKRDIAIHKRVDGLSDTLSKHKGAIAVIAILFPVATAAFIKFV